MRGKEPWEDDGRTIADMSGITRPPLLIPRIKRNTDEAKPTVSQSPFEKKERFYAVLGAVGAALLVAMIFMAGIGLAIFLMLQIWT